MPSVGTSRRRGLLRLIALPPAQQPGKRSRPTRCGCCVCGAGVGWDLCGRAWVSLIAACLGETGRSAATRGGGGLWMQLQELQTRDMHAAAACQRLTCLTRPAPRPRHRP